MCIIYLCKLMPFVLKTMNHPLSYKIIIMTYLKVTDYNLQLFTSSLKAFQIILSGRCDVRLSSGLFIPTVTVDDR